MNTDKSFAELLLYWRSKAGLSQEDLAQKSRVSKVQIAKYETNKSTPRLKAIMKLANALNISTEDLGYKTLPNSAIFGEQTEARVLLGIMNLKDQYLNTIIMQREEGSNFEDMIIEIRDEADKNMFFNQIEQIAKNNNVIINLKELSPNKYSLSLKFQYLNITRS